MVIETGHYNLLSDGVRWTEDLFVQSVVDNRASYISIHGWPEKFLKENRRAIDRTNRILGYRLELRKVEYPDVSEIGSPMPITSEWMNVGVAKCYAGATLCWTLLDGKGRVIWTVVDTASNAKEIAPSAFGNAKPRRFVSTCRFGIAATIPVINDGVLVCAKKEIPGVFDALKVPSIRPGAYTLAVSFGSAQGTPELALPLDGGLGRRYPVGHLSLVEKGN